MKISLFRLTSPTFLLTSALTFVFVPPAPAQSIPSPAPTVPAAKNDEVIELNPFTVNTTKDIGYLAENTLAGSRLNTKLRDTPAAVSVFTKEFIEDLGITDIK